MHICIHLYVLILIHTYIKYVLILIIIRIYIHISATSKGKHVSNYSKYLKTGLPTHQHRSRDRRCLSNPKAQHLQRGQPGAINMESGAALVGKPGVSGVRS